MTFVCTPCYSGCFGVCKNRRCECAECGGLRTAQADAAFAEGMAEVVADKDAHECQSEQWSHCAYSDAGLAPCATCAKQGCCPNCGKTDRVAGALLCTLCGQAMQDALDGPS